MVETEIHGAVPNDISVISARALTAVPRQWNDDQALVALAAAIRDGEAAAIDSLKMAGPQIIILGEGGFSVRKAVFDANRDRYETLAGVGVVTSAHAFLAALEALNLTRVAVLTPRLPDSGIVSGGLWEECGFEVCGARGMGCRSAAEISSLSETTLREALAELARTRAQAILVTGSNMRMMGLADEAERWLGKHVLHLNTVLLWNALRRLGFRDRIQGVGTLFRDA